MSQKMRKPIRRRKRDPVRRDKRGRARGVTSVECPRCSSPSRVERTARSGGATVRTRVCSRGHRFGTMEAPLDG